VPKPKYDSHVKPRLETIRAWKRRGLTDEEIYKNLGVGRDSFYRYINEHSELSEVLKSGLSDAVALMENAHFKSGLGYEYEEKRIVLEPVFDADGNPVLDKNGNPVTKRRIERTTKHVQGNVTAQIHFLKNRASKDWHDRKELELTGADGKDLVIQVKHKRHDN
jgi:hypothetical protein